MSTQGSGSCGPAAAASPAAVEDTSGHWAPHGPVLTACVVGLNALMIFVIFFFFWRLFSSNRGRPSSGAAAAADDDASSTDSMPVASPWAAFRRVRADSPAAQPPDVDVVSSLPVYAYASADAGGQAAECAVCIVDLRDGDAARRLPRCGHRFHADCIGAWLRLHATCPLCRAIVAAPADAGAATPKDDAATDCPV